MSELVVGMPKIPPPKEVMDKLKGCELIIGIDVETHDLIPKMPRYGQKVSSGSKP